MSGPKFTDAMKKDYTILIPDMTTIHFRFLARIFRSCGYRVEVLYNQGPAVVDEGLKYVHNDTCYPALLCIGQMLDALHSGKYDVHKTALLLTQTGGGCRASNYICLLRKALDKAGFDFVPVLSLNFAGLDENAIHFTVPMVVKAMMAVVYGDLLMLLRNQTIPYEKEKGAAERLTQAWTDRLLQGFCSPRLISRRTLRKNLDAIAASFAAIEKDVTPKVKVGIVGEIYVKYAALGNNNLEQFLYDQGCETMVPGLYDFLMYCVQNSLEDFRLYGGSRVKKAALTAVVRFLNGIRDEMRAAAQRHGFCAPSPFAHLLELAGEVIGRGCKMGEGWLLSGEMMELAELGYANIITVQPFGCLPNHIVAKGMARAVKERCPQANIVAIDYDPGATRVNQENRIKLMLSIARENLERKVPLRV
ncbi:MAG: 2-hydroxyglutaryl-CoA dehydratase [Oscillospiraceae bacterium]|nr:2-hydroxyglutaryl-CoA dehydratase [Oscillospiraceae bacterium]